MNIKFLKLLPIIKQVQNIFEITFWKFFGLFMIEVSKIDIFELNLEVK